MLQAPYGTGIFICRKGLIENVLTKEAEYVEGMDLTLMARLPEMQLRLILFTYGPFGWFEKVSILQMRTQFLCNELDKLNSYFRSVYEYCYDSCRKFRKNCFRLWFMPQQHNANGIKLCLWTM